MARTLFGTLAALVALAGIAGPCVLAADTLHAVLPEKTLAVVRLNRLAETDTKLAEFARRAQWPMPSLLDLFKSQAGVKEGLDEKGCAALVVVGEDQFDEPPILLFVPVTDYDKFLAPVKRGESKPGIAQVEVWSSKFLAKRVGSYAVFAEPQHESVLETGMSPGALSEELASLAPYLAENELSAVVTSHGIFFGARVAEQHIRQIRELLLGDGEESAGPMKILELYGHALNALENQATCLAAGVRLEKQGGLRLTGRASLVARGLAAAAVAQFAPMKEEPLLGLPSGPFVFAGGATLPAQLVSAIGEPYAEVLKAVWGRAGLAANRIDQFAKQSVDLFRSARSHSVLLQPGRGVPVYRDALLAMRVESAAKFQADYEKLMRSYAELLKPAASKLGPAIPVAVDIRRTQINGLPALEATSQMPLAGEPQLQQALERLFGQGGKSTTYLAAPDEHTVLVSYASKELLSAAVDAIKTPAKGLAADPQLAKTRALLPADALAVAYWSPRGTSLFAGRMLSVFGDAPGVPKTLPEFPDTPPVGLAVRTAPAQVQLELVVPGEVVESLMEYAMRSLAAFQLGR